MNKRFWLPLALLMVLSMILVALPAYADPNGNVTTTAQVTGVGQPPVVEQKWELATGAMTQGTDQIFTPDPTPGALNGFDVWTLVSDPFGIDNISAVYADIYKPGKTPPGDPYYKQVHCSVVTYLDTNVAVVNSAIDAGIAHGSISVAAGLAKDNLYKHIWQAWNCHVPYSICNPVDEPGNWHVNAWASDGIGTVSAGKWNQYTISPVKALALDFTAIDYGPIRPGLSKWIRGDVIFLISDGMPTVQIRGNIAGTLKVASSQMVGVALKKIIDNFDVKLGTGPDVTYNSTSPATPLGPIDPCVTTQMDFSIHPDVGIPADTYNGTMVVSLNP